MKGEIFNLFEAFVTETFGQEQFELIFEAVHGKLSTQEPFVGPGTYPDTDFFAVVGEAISQLGVSLEEAAHAFGKYCFPKLAAKMPQYVEAHTHPKEFLLTLHDVIHVEVKKVFKDAAPPDFTYEEPSADKLIMIYRSKRKLYSFAEGLFEGVSNHFQVPIDVRRNIVSEENGECRFELTFGAVT